MLEINYLTCHKYRIMICFLYLIHLKLSIAIKTIQMQVDNKLFSQQIRIMHIHQNTTINQHHIMVNFILQFHPLFHHQSTIVM